MLPRLAFLLKNLANTLQNVLNTIKLTPDFRFKKAWPWSHWRKKGKNHKLPSFRRSLKFKETLACETFTQRFPLFSTDSQLSTRMLIFRKQTRKQKNLFLAFPSLKYLDSYDVSKNSEHIKTFRRLDSKVNSQNGKVSKTFSITVNKSFTQGDTGKR